MTTAARTKTTFCTGLSANDNSFQAGKFAAYRALSKSDAKQAQLGIVFASSRYKYEEVLLGVRSVAGDTPIIGCSSASEFTEDRVTKNSVACAFISTDSFKFYTAMARRLSADPAMAFRQAVAAMPAKDSDFPQRSAIILVDTVAGTGEAVSRAAVNALGPDVTIAGGAAADNLAFNNCSVFHNSKAYSDSLSLCILDSKVPVGVGVQHGHIPISPPLTLTKTQGNVVYEIDNLPAWEVWKEYTRHKAYFKNIDVDEIESKAEIGAFLLQYEAGLLAGENYKIRAPLALNSDGSINFAAAMEQGSVFRIMESPSKEWQIQSAKASAIAAVNSADPGTKFAGAIVFDCICRNLILDHEFKSAVMEIKQVIGDIPLIGLATYGEIAVTPGQQSGFHNTSTVVLLIPE